MSKKTTTPAKTKKVQTKASKKAKKLPPISEILNEEGDEEGEEGLEGGKIKAILTLWIKGYSRKDIIAAGFNKSTTYRQIGEYERLKNAPATQYQGFQIFEGRVQAIMKAKHVSRQDAVKMIMKKDLEG